MRKTYQTGMFLIVFMCIASLCFADAYGDLEGMRNTGITFDGSDGERQPMDTWGTPSAGDIPEPPPPPPPPEPSVPQTQYVEDNNVTTTEPAGQQAYPPSGYDDRNGSYPVDE